MHTTATDKNCLWEHEVFSNFILSIFAVTNSKLSNFYLLSNRNVLDYVFSNIQFFIIIILFNQYRTAGFMKQPGSFEYRNGRRTFY